MLQQCACRTAALFYWTTQQLLLSLQEDAADTFFDEMLQRKSARSVRRWNFSSLESEAVDRLQVGEDDAGETTGDLGAGRKRQRPCRPTSVSAAGAAAAADAVMEDGEESDTHIYDCPCGIQTDDGGHMIQCDLCKAWAHIACLQELVSQAQGHRSLSNTPQCGVLVTCTRRPFCI